MLYRLKNMLYTLWTVWCAIAFVITSIVLFPFLVFMLSTKNKRLMKYSHRIPALAGKIVMFLWGIRIKEFGKSKIRASKQYVFAGNHRSDLDAPLSAAIMPGYFKYIGKSEILSWPILGYVLKKLYIPVNRGDKLSRKDSMQQMLAKSADGASIVVFAEGWSNFSEDLLLPLKRGAFQLAIEGQVPLALFTLIGTHERWPKPKWQVRPGTVKVFWEDIIETKGMTIEKDFEALKAKARQVFLKRLRHHYPNGYPYTNNEPTKFRQWMQKQLGRDRRGSK